jgi:hypothetical protein
VKKALNSLRRLGEIEIEDDDDARHDGVKSDPAEFEYGAYVRLMLRELCVAKGNVDELDRMLMEHAVHEYGDKFLSDLLDETLGDRSPILFELCTIGCGQRQTHR